MTLVSAGQAVTGPGGRSTICSPSARDRSAPSAICGAPSGPGRCSGSRSRRPASAFRCSSAWMSSTATARSSRCRSPRWGRSTRTCGSGPRAAASEAAADGVAMTYAPMLDVARDPRWGRIAEGPARTRGSLRAIARAKVRGFQGGDLRRPPPGRDRQAPGRLRRGHRRARLRGCGHLGALAARGVPAAVPSGGRGRRRRDHAGVPRPGRRADDRPMPPAARLAARALGLRRRHRQRLLRRSPSSWPTAWPRTWPRRRRLRFGRASTST